MTSQIQPNLSRRGVTWHWLSAWVACSKHALKKVRTQKYGIFISNESNRRSKYPAFKRIFFSYRYWWFAAKLRQRGANQTVRTVYSILGILRTDLWSQGTLQTDHINFLDNSWLFCQSLKKVAIIERLFRQLERSLLVAVTIGKR